MSPLLSSTPSNLAERERLDAMASRLVDVGDSDATSLLAMSGSVIVVGIGAGLGGMALGLLLHFVQHAAFGYSQNTLISPESFLDGVERASALRRFLVVSSCGLVAGFGWAALYRWGSPLISISRAIKFKHPRMPFVATGAHALLQIITVALGSPLGREVAPREIGALFAGLVASKIGLSIRDSRILVACGAGGGLAAVYNVPVAATIFVLEVLLCTVRPVTALFAFATCLIAAVCARVGLGNESQYAEAHYAVSASLMAWALVFGPLLGMAGHSFRMAMLHAQLEAPSGLWMTFGCFMAFLFVATLSIYFPQLLGNGKGPAQLTFSENVDPLLAMELLLMKVLIIFGVLKAGARGGLLTPGLAVGALFATILGVAWNLFMPTVPVGAVAITGASAFLGSSMSMPITALALTVEFMHLPFEFILPLALAAAGATLTRIALQRRALALASAPPVASA